MTSISLPGASGSFFVKSVFTCWACVAVANPKVKINTERMSFFMLCIASVLSVICCDNRWRGPKIKRDLSATPLSIPISCLLFGRYPQALESDCGTYEKTTESRARAERWEHPGDRLRDRRFPV